MPRRIIHPALVILCVILQWMVTVMPRGAAICVGCERADAQAQAADEEGCCCCCHRDEPADHSDSSCGGFVPAPGDFNAKSCCRTLSLPTITQRAEPRTSSPDVVEKPLLGLAAAWTPDIFAPRAFTPRVIDARSAPPRPRGCARTLPLVI